MGVTLLEQGHPICFHCKKFCDMMRNASTYVWELHVIVEVVKKWQHYLLGRKFIICTDQKSLKELLTHVIQTLEQQHYLCKLLGFDYEMKYILDSFNCTTDALSRQFDEGFLAALTIPHYEFIHKLKASYDYDTQLKL